MIRLKDEHTKLMIENGRRRGQKAPTPGALRATDPVVFLLDALPDAKVASWVSEGGTGEGELVITIPLTFIGVPITS